MDVGAKAEDEGCHRDLEKTFQPDAPWPRVTNTIRRADIEITEPSGDNVHIGFELRRYVGGVAHAVQSEPSSQAEVGIKLVFVRRYGARLNVADRRLESYLGDWT